MMTQSFSEEWGPTPEQLFDWPELADELQRPTFLLISARLPISLSSIGPE
jgi:hypothetical protein